MSKTILKNSKVIDFPFTPKVPRPPKGLAAAGREQWRKIQAEYQIHDAGGIAHLTTVCRAEDDLDRMRKKVKKHGDVLTDRFGQKIAHPLLAAIRGMEAVRRQALRELQLDIEPLKNGPGRPGGS